MMKREWDVLFSEYDLRRVLEAQLEAVSDRVLELGEALFARNSDEELAARVASRLVVSPLRLLEDEISVASRDAKIDVRYDMNRAVRDRSVPAYVDGVEVTYHVPFEGEPKLLKCQPSAYSLNPPRAVIAMGELRFPYDQADRDVTATKRSFQEDLRGIKESLPRINDQVREYNATLEERVRGQVAARRADLARTQSDIASLGFKVRTETTKPEPKVESAVRAERRVRVRRSQRKNYDVALSFAGEDREYVEKVAEELRTAGVEVFYDEFEKVTLWGQDLAEHLGHVYGEDARFVVLFLSRAYVGKAWPSHEKRIALARLINQGVGALLPVRFDDSEVPGLPETIAFLDLRVLTPTKLAELIRQKVDANDA